MNRGQRFGTRTRAGAPPRLGRLMRVAVSFQDEELVLDVPEDGLVGEWHGPAGVGPEEAARLVREALEDPRQYPPLRQAVVPGDQVVIALDPEVPSAETVVAAV